MIFTNKELTEKIEKFLNDNCMSATAFGIGANKDPNLVFNIRDGRECGERIQSLITEFMDNYKKEEK